MKIHHFAFIVKLATNNTKPIGYIKITMFEAFFEYFDATTTSFFLCHANDIRFFDINIDNDFENIDSSFIRDLFTNIEKMNILHSINEKIDLTYKYNDENFVETELKKTN